MAQKPDDRLKPMAPSADQPLPKVYFVINGERFVRPGLETYFAETQDSTIAKEKSILTCSCHPVTTTYCSCNKVCSCNLVCTCQSVCGSHGARSCGCVGFSGSRTYCSCNKVCTCVPVH